MLSEAGRRGLDDAVDLVGAAVVEGVHQAELGQRLGEERRASLMRLVSMSVLSIMPLFLLADAAPASRQRIEQKRWCGNAVPAQLVDVAEAAGLPAAKGADAYPSKSRHQALASSGWSPLIRCEPSTTKRQMAFVAMASSSAMVSAAMG